MRVSTDKTIARCNLSKQKENGKNLKPIQIFSSRRRALVQYASHFKKIHFISSFFLRFLSFDFSFYFSFLAFVSFFSTNEYREQIILFQNSFWLLLFPSSGSQLLLLCCFVSLRSTFGVQRFVLKRSSITFLIYLCSMYLYALKTTTSAISFFFLLFSFYSLHFLCVEEMKFNLNKSCMWIIF